MAKLNCWEYRKCGREPGGKNAKKYETCPATISTNYNGINNGKNGGRFCWAVSGTFCEGEPSGTYTEKLFDCLKCAFLKKVNEEEHRGFILSPEKKQ